MAFIARLTSPLTFGKSVFSSRVGGNDVDLGRKYMRIEYRYTDNPVSPLMGSEAPCCGGGLSGNCLLIIHFIC